jgi:hypothetical protein
LPTAVERLEDVVELLAGQLSVAVAVGAVEEQRAGRRCQRVRREVEIGLGQRPVVVAIEPGEVRVGAGELLAGDPPVAVAVEPLAG